MIIIKIKDDRDIGGGVNDLIDLGGGPVVVPWVEPGLLATVSVNDIVTVDMVLDVSSWREHRLSSLPCNGASLNTGLAVHLQDRHLNKQ